jgi:hypothetical protein
MRKLTAVVAGAAFAGVAVAGCGGSSGPAHHAAASAAGYGTQCPAGTHLADGSCEVNTPATPAQPSSLLSVLTCSTVVQPGPSDGGLRGHNLTAQDVIADLEAMMLIDGIRNVEPGGTPSRGDSSVLNNAAIDLGNYSGNKLSKDASRYVSDEQNYNPYPDEVGRVDSSYASAVQRDTRRLIRDCPGAAAEGIKKAGR